MKNMMYKNFRHGMQLLACTVLAFPLASLFSPAFAQATQDYELAEGLSFWSELSSDTVEALGRSHDNENLEYIRRQNYNAEFAGIKETLGVRFESDLLDMELAPEFSLKDNAHHWYLYDSNWSSTSHALNSDDLSFAYTGLGWHLRFSPFDVVDVNLHNNVRTPGGQLPVAGQWLSASDLQGDGIGVVLTPLEGLRIGIEAPVGFAVLGIPNMLNAEYEDSNGSGQIVIPWNAAAADCMFALNAGADWRIASALTVGATVHNMFNGAKRAFGLYANASLAFLEINAGYTYNGEATRVSFLDFDGMGLERVYIGGRHRANLAVTAQAGGLQASVEALYNFVNTQSIYDLYAGAKVSYELLPGRFSLWLAAGMAMDLGNKVKDGVGYAEEREQGKAKQLMYTEGTYWFFPVKGSGARDGSQRRAETAATLVEWQPGIRYTTGRNTFGAKANLQYWTDGEWSWAVNFPVSWRYTF